MKFLAKWYLLFFIALSSLVFVGCNDRISHMLERDYGFSHGTALFIATAIFTLVAYINKKRRGE